jgi:hypothetical protein
VHQDIGALKFASKQLRGDREFLRQATQGIAEKQEALKAVETIGTVLEFIREGLQSDHDVVLAAVHQDAGALKFTSKQLRSDRQFAIEMLQRNGFALEHLSDELRDSREIVLEAVRQDGRALRLAPRRWISDPEVLRSAANGALAASLDAPNIAKCR